MLAESPAPPGSWDPVLDGMEKPPSVYTKSIFFAREKSMTRAIVLMVLWEEQLSRRRKLWQTGPEQSAQAAVQLKSNPVGFLDPHKYTDLSVIWTVAWRGGRVMTKHRCSKRDVLLCGHTRAASPRGPGVPIVLPFSGSYTQTITGLRWPGLRCLLDITNSATWIFAVVATYDWQLHGGASSDPRVVRSSL